MTLEDVENLSTGIATKIYDTVDVSLQRTLGKKSEVDALKSQLVELNYSIEKLKRELQSDSLPEVEFNPPELSEEQVLRAMNLAKSVEMVSRLTATSCVQQSDGSYRIMCGNFMLKPGVSYDGLQANWDLIDTATGADM